MSPPPHPASCHRLLSPVRLQLDCDRIAPFCSSGHSVGGSAALLFLTYTSDVPSGTMWLKLLLKEARRRPANQMKEPRKHRSADVLNNSVVFNVQKCNLNSKWALAQVLAATAFHSFYLGIKKSACRDLKLARDVINIPQMHARAVVKIPSLVCLTPEISRSAAKKAKKFLIVCAPSVIFQQQSSYECEAVWQRTLL